MAAGNNHFGNRNDQCWVYRSTFPDGDILYGAVDIFLKRNDIS
jgi:hypothetical protein